MHRSDLPLSNQPPQPPLCVADEAKRFGIVAR